MKRVVWVMVLGLWSMLSMADGLPDFTELVAKQVNTVVNISATTNAHHPTGKGGAPAIPQDDPMYEFFKRFGIPMTPMPGDGDPSSEEEQRSMGSGFIFSSDGYIMTNSHVVQGADEVVVTLQDGRSFKAKVVGIDRKTDVAVLKIPTTGLPVAKMGDSNKVKVGEWVVAIGSPFGFESSVTKGIVSAKGRSLPRETLVPFIQTDVPINPGNSGGPLFNMQGEVIGVNSQIYSRTGGYMGLSFAIPSNVASQVANQLIVSGKVTRGWMGVVIQEVTPELADSFGVGKPRGALVASVEKGGPGCNGGIRASDIILRFSGQEVNTQEDLPRMVSAAKPGTSVEVQVWRKGALQDLTVKLGEMPGEKVAAKEGGAVVPEVPKGMAGKLGLVLDDLTGDQIRDLDVSSGVVIQKAFGAAARSGLRNGDVILSINNMPVHSVKEFNQILGRLDSRKVLALLVKRGDNSEFLSLKPE